MKTWSPDPNSEGFELTPMIDVVFLLIAFFMTITSEITEENVRIQIPIASEAVVPEETGIRQTITIDADGNIFFGAREMGTFELTDAIRRVLTVNPDTRVYLRADTRTTHRFVREVMEATAEAGLTDIIFATNQE